jgi:hypothetical protein
MAFHVISPEFKTSCGLKTLWQRNVQKYNFKVTQNTGYISRNVTEYGAKKQKKNRRGRNLNFLRLRWTARLDKERNIEKVRI